ncbi:MAG: hypothetical protein JRI70_10540 [Deltaproteobacteria bacterium]|nr:hypothetical protein [Deltaproteobacteria bacterium]
MITSTEVFGSVEKVFSSILKDIDVDHRFIIAKDNPYQVEPFSFWHLFQDDYWISNTLSTSILDNAGEMLRNTVLGEDPLFQAGKRFGAHFQPWKLTAMKMMNADVFLRFAVKKNSQMNKIKEITPLLGKNHVTAKAKYYRNITRTKSGALTSKSICHWYRGCMHFYLNLIELKDIEIDETACTADGDDECVFEINYKPLSFPKKIRNFLFHSLRPDFAMNYENALWASHISTFNAEQLVKERTAELVDANERLKQEIEARRLAERELVTYRDQLEELVEQRTTQLTAANKQLKQEINDRKRAEQEARLQQEQLFQASKMASLGTLVSGVAHEINNPISFITLNGPTLQKVWQDVTPVLDEHHRKNGDFYIANMDYDDLRERIPVLLSDITEGAKRVSTIVTDLKEFARQSAPEFTDKVDINKVTKTAVGLVSNTVKKSTNRFSQTYEPSVPLIKGNVHRIEQVVINLLANASQALTNSEQAVSVSTTYDHKSDCVVVEVQDEGVGMSADVLQQITDPFFTTKRDTAGTGQGTAVKVYFPASTVSKEESRFENERHS